MVRKSASLTALFALAANGFMIPSTMSLPEVNGESLSAIIDSLPSFSDLPDMPKMPDPAEISEGLDWQSVSPTLTILDEAEYLSVDLACEDCPLPDDHPSPQDIQTSILNFRVELDGPRTSFLVGGQSVYPTQSTFLDITQETIDKNLDRHAMLDRRTSYSIEYDDVRVEQETGSQLIAFRLYLTALDDKPIRSAQYINVKLIESISGRLSMLSIDTPMPSDAASLSVCSGPAFLCNIVSFVESKMAAWRSQLHHHKPCRAGRLHGMRPTFDADVHSVRPYESEDVELSWPAMDAPHRDLELEYGHYFGVDRASDLDSYRQDRDRSAHNGHHRHHHDRLHGFAMGLHRFLFGFLIPVFIGIAAGMFASGIGMIIGTSVAWLWIRFVRKNKRGPYARVASDATADEAALDADAKVGLLEIQSVQEECPPLYVEKE